MKAPQVKYSGPPTKAAMVMPVIQSDFSGAQCTQPASALVTPWSNIRGDLKVVSDFVSAASMGSKLSATPGAMGSAISTIGTVLTGRRGPPRPVTTSVTGRPAAVVPTPAPPAKTPCGLETSAPTRRDAPAHIPAPASTTP